jgi:6-phosphofructokinase
VAEGAVDCEGVKITSEEVKNSIIEKMGMDARVTTLGHIQRGGSPSALDRYLATIQGIRAVISLIENDSQKSLSFMVVTNENHVDCRPISECVQMTKQINSDFKVKKFDSVFKARDNEFRFLFDLQSLFCSYSLHPRNASEEMILKIALVNVGAPCGGMNSANAAIAKYSISVGHQILGIYDGLKGLLNSDFRYLQHNDIQGWIERGGSALGASRWLPNTEEIGQIVSNIKKENIDAIIVIGGFEGFSFLASLRENSEYLAHNFPVLLIPATVSNNVPGTEYSIGSDTALNTIISSCDVIRQSASSSGNRVFIVEVQGGNCGYLATTSALSCGASSCFIPERDLTLKVILDEIEHLKFRFKEYSKIGRIVIRNENCPKVYSTETLSNIFEKEANGTFDSRWIVLGHLQQGGNPSPLDRLRGVKLGTVCIDYIEKILLSDSDRSDSIPSIGVDSGITTPYQRGGNILVVGVKGPKIVFSPIDTLIKEADMNLRRMKNPWWSRLYPLISMLSRDPNESMSNGLSGK